ncbi:SAM-dependent methyltransferase [Thiocapsa imhoffii]|uniref:SAM-dependent methyltransferase n=1 Tax=Thiocapsa imhoffii TaxID=382777 RepID=A0A9X1B8X9_9GAMM|nr:class I SAM-dependent methyltransferase [Thiocapsa imhoffii]MBK1645272.1 SAM-dependent methyltransferase [Thiocapsa imhoffii]
MNHKQVDKSIYEFGTYVTKCRWASFWHQADEVLAFDPETVLEIGPGPGVFKAVLSRFGPHVETLDLDPELSPDHIASADAMPFDDRAYDVVCAFQMLEHVPYEKSMEIFREMVRVAAKGVVISLPDAAKRWPMGFHIPRVGMKWFSVPKPRLRPLEHRFDGQHYWEINKVGYCLSRILHDLQHVAPVQLVRTYRVSENPYHRFFVYQTK